MIRAVALLAAVALAGCSMEPRLETPALPVPPSWPTGDAYLRRQEAALPSVAWRGVFRDGRLQQIVNQALANNRDLRVAAATIAATREQYRIQRAALFPQLDATGGYSYARRGVGSLAGTGIGGTSAIRTETYSVDLGLSWEIDLFGRLRSLSDAALRRYFGQEATARATRLTLVGDIADAWLTYATDRSLMTIAEDTVRSAAQSVRLTRARLDGGIAPRTDLRQAEQILATAQADVAAQKTALAQDANALQLLVGAPVDAALLPASIEEAGGTIGELPAGLDSTILLRRPDVVQAEYELRAVNAEIGAARAALFPTLSLTGAIGFASQALSALFDKGSYNYSVSPSVGYSVFRAGAGLANVRATQAQRDAALATYERTVQSAFREVSDALARRGTITDEIAANRRLRDAALDTAQLQNARYLGGIDTFLAALDAQRTLYSAQRALAGTQLTRASNLVTLYRTLGGDQTLEATPEGPQPVNPQEPYDEAAAAKRR